MNKIKLAILSTIGSVLLHTYLSWIFYPIKFAQSTGESLCNINETLNCDAVAASSFSALWGIPLSVWGGMTNFILLLLLLIYSLRFTEKLDQTLRHSFYLAFFIAITSLVMGAISIIYLGTYCLFCIFAYVLSFVTLGALWSAQTSKPFSQLARDLMNLFVEGRATIFMLASIPVMSYILHFSVISNYGADKLDRLVKNAILEWSANNSNDFFAEPSYVSGPSKDKAAMVIAEFADYLCPHCKHAAPSLHAFATSHKDVRFEFYSFPLEGNCNEAITRNANGVRCFLAKSTYCSNQQEAGSAIHSSIFVNQEEFAKVPDGGSALELLKKVSPNQKMDWEKLSTCIESEETHQVVLDQAKNGEEAGVSGTPTIYVNGKILPRGQLIPVLEGAYQYLRK